MGAERRRPAHVGDARAPALTSRFVAVSAGVSNRRVEGAPTVRFATVARRLGAATWAAGLTVPAFRTPPRRPGAPRTIRRLPGGPVVAVALQGRVFTEVVHDMVDGVIVANRLEGEAAGRVRGSLLHAITAPGSSAAA